MCTDGALREPESEEQGRDAHLWNEAVEPHDARKAFVVPLGVPVAADELEVGEAAAERLERDTQAEPGEGRAEAVVSAGAECELLTRFAVEVELVGVRIAFRVATGRHDIGGRDLPGAQLNVLADHVVRGEPRDVLRGWGEAKHLGRSGRGSPWAARPSAASLPCVTRRYAPVHTAFAVASSPANTMFAASARVSSGVSACAARAGREQRGEVVRGLRAPTGEQVVHVVEDRDGRALGPFAPFGAHEREERPHEVERPLASRARHRPPGSRRDDR